MASPDLRSCDLEIEISKVDGHDRRVLANVFVPKGHSQATANRARLESHVTSFTSMYQVLTMGDLGPDKAFVFDAVLPKINDPIIISRLMNRFMNCYVFGKAVCAGCGEPLAEFHFHDKLRLLTPEEEGITMRLCCITCLCVVFKQDYDMCRETEHQGPLTFATLFDRGFASMCTNNDIDAYDLSEEFLVLEIDKNPRSFLAEDKEFVESESELVGGVINWSDEGKNTHTAFIYTGAIEGRNAIKCTFGVLNDEEHIASVKYISYLFKNYIFNKAECANCGHLLLGFYIHELTKNMSDGRVQYDLCCKFCIGRIFLLDHENCISVGSKKTFPLWHIHRTAQISDRRKYRERMSEGSYTKKDVATLFTQQGGKCKYCKSEFSEVLPYTVDHRIPLADGGTNWPDNLALACKSCNSTKSDKSEEWLMQELKRRSNKRYR